MGLDMYLTAERYLWRYSKNGDEKSTVTAALKDFVPEGFQVEKIKISVGYWRKANHIHRWFVDNVQSGEDDCGDYYVPRQKLQELRDVCQQVLDDHDLAPSLLPTQSGFFFGSTEYDEYYFADVKDTIEIIDKALTLPEADWDMQYHSSW